MAEEKIISDADIESLIINLKNASVEEYFNLVDVDWKVLQQQAKIFLKSYNDLITLENTNKLKNLNKLLQGDPEDSYYLKSYSLNSRKEAQYTRAKYLLAFHFDKAVNKFRQELPKKAVYVYENKNTHELSAYEMSLEDLAKYANKEGRLSISLSKLKAEGREKLENNNLIDEKHLLAARSAYIGTVNRLSRYFEKRKDFIGSVDSRKVQMNNGILMWKMGKDWTLARVLNKGDLKEAYVSALMAKHKSILDYLWREMGNSIETKIGSEPYYSHLLVSTFFKNYVTKVTSTPAIKEEDVITDSRQYAVKGQFASLPSINQYIETAQWIVEQTSPFSNIDLKNFFDNNFGEASARNIIIGKTSQVLENTYTELGLKDYEYYTIKSVLY